MLAGRAALRVRQWWNAAQQLLAPWMWAFACPVATLVQRCRLRYLRLQARLGLDASSWLRSTRQGFVQSNRRKQLRRKGRLRTPSTLVLDLDETLVHSHDRRVSARDVRLELNVGRGRWQEFFVLRRPFLDEFLAAAVDAGYELVVFTASVEEYASPVIDLIDPGGLISRRFYRDSCLYEDGEFVKDLSVVNDDLRGTIIIDNSVLAFARQPDSAIPIEAFYDDEQDDALRRLIPFLEALRSVQDVRSVLELRRRTPAPSEFPLEPS